MKKAKYIICVVVILLAIIGINETAYTTNENEYSVVKQFGKIVATNNSAGLRFKVQPQVLKRHYRR